MGHQWREREINPAQTVHMFTHQIRSGNCACNELRHLSGIDVTGSAYCQARQRLPLEVIKRINTEVDRAFLETKLSQRLWHGHRVALLDGSSFSMSDEAELREEFGGPSGQAEGCGFPAAHILAMFDLGTGMLRDIALAPMNTNDLAQVATLHPILQEGDITLGDRAFCSFAHLALTLAARRHAVFRAHQKQIIDFTRRRPHVMPGDDNPRHRPTSRWIKRLGQNDQLVEYYKPRLKPDWMTQAQYDALPASITVREIRYTIRTSGCRTEEVTLVTTLLDAGKYSAKEIARLYGLRWVVEGNLRYLKTQMGMEVLKCKTVDGVTKELMMFVLVYNLVRTIMIDAGHRQRVDPRRISFMDALRWLKHAPPGSDLPELVVNPHRPNRAEPRVKKRRPKDFDLMNKPRAQLRHALVE